MGKVITSPVKKWQGTVTLRDPLSLPQVVAIQDANAEVQALGKKTTLQKQHNILVPVLLDCIEKWDLEGIDDPPNPFPASPLVSSAKLANWLLDEVGNLLIEDDEEKKSE